jgi:hypothetical protein
MKLRRLGVGLALATATLVATAMPARAETSQPTAAFSGQLIAAPGVAIVRIAYTCYSNDSPMNHLFVGLKQGPQVNTTDHSSSQFAQTFYSTNWLSDAGPNKLRCDGRAHTQIIVLKPQPGFQPTVNRLQNGLALVQICVYDNVTQFSPDGEPLDGGFAASYTMEQVRAF